MLDISFQDQQHRKFDALMQLFQLLSCRSITTVTVTTHAKEQNTYFM